MGIIRKKYYTGKLFIVKSLRKKEKKKYGEKIILTSATIIDPLKYIKSLGIKKEDCMFIEEESKFESSKSPIYVSDLNSLNYKNKHTVLPKLATLVKKILDHHDNEKGIIHTHTNEISDYLQKKIKSDRLLFRDIENDNNAILKKHETPNNPSVLVSPSLGRVRSPIHRSYHRLLPI